jgi:hypothetical protein
VDLAELSAIDQLVVGGLNRRCGSLGAAGL